MVQTKSAPIADWIENLALPAHTDYRRTPN